MVHANQNIAQELSPIADQEANVETGVCKHQKIMGSMHTAQLTSHRLHQCVEMQRTLVVQELLTSLGGVLGVGRLNNGINGT